MKLGAIKRRQAEWLGNAAAVAGGWVMVGEEWMNDSRVEFLLAHDELLAAIPDTFTTVQVRPISREKILSTLNSDIELNSTRTWSLKSREADVENMTKWRDRIKELV